MRKNTWSFIGFDGEASAVTLPNRFEVAGGLELGLTQEQVSIPNFGFHTINAIRAERDKGETLEDAFEKYRDLDNVKIAGMTKLGLSREQVLIPNFGFHTIDATKDIRKRSKNLSLADAFNMVKGKSYHQTKALLKNYLEATKNKQKHISEMTLIRVVVNTGGGFGHQRAAITLMQKLREVGFKGTFDIQCDDKLDASLWDNKTEKMYTNTKPLVSCQLKTMIPGFESSRPTRDRVRVVSGLGKVKISSLPHDYMRREDLGLPESDLAVCAADDHVVLNLGKEGEARKFNAESYIRLEPTDWHQGSCYVTDQDGIVTDLPPASIMRLSSSAASQLPDIDSISLSPTEERIVAITRCDNINSQLVYGLLPARCQDIEVPGRMKETGKLDEAIEMLRIIEANHFLSKKIGKPSILLLPQAIALDFHFRQRVGNGRHCIHFVDCTKGDLDLTQYKTGDLVVAHTGRLQQAVFDYLMLEGTTLPPVIEGCNSREICESAGRPFIHGSGKHNPLKEYKVEAVDKQHLHALASLCLEQGDKRYVPALCRYMEESLSSNGELIEYHKQRRKAFLERPDACEFALNTLGVQYECESLETKCEHEGNNTDTPLVLTGFFSKNLKRAFSSPKGPGLYADKPNPYG